VQRREHPRNDPAVRHRVPGAGRGLDPVVEDDPAVGGAAEVDTTEEQLAPGHRPRRPPPGVQVAGMPVDDLHRHQPAADRVPGAVEVREQPVRELGPLRDRDLQRGPVRAVEDQGERVQLPELLVLGAGRVVGDAVVREQAFGVRAAGREPGRAGGVEHPRQPCPQGTDVAGGGPHLVGRRALRGAGARVAGSLAGRERAHRRAAPARRRSGRPAPGVRRRVAGRSRTG
jgi:hypothetical protein